jgi:uncharacterized protein (DUF2147 family)
MRIALSGAVLAMLTVGVPGAQAQSPAVPTCDEIYGTWVNPHGDMKVRADVCGEYLCGKVIEAAQNIQDDARKAGTMRLIGKDLLANFRKTSARMWEGTLFVPARGGTYASKIQQIDAFSIRISGCVIGGLICKSEIWHKE